MSHALPAEARERDDPIDERVRELDAIEDELRLVISADCTYATYCQTWLAALEEARTDA